MKRVKLTVAYEGTNYAGWQIQKNAVSIEEVLNKTLSELTGEDIVVVGASRTDAGVHALGNVAVFDTESRIPGEKFSYALNQRLPEDIRILGSEEVDAAFHPRYTGSVKTYEYRILNHPFQIPSYRHNTYFYHRALHVEAMREAAQYLIGEHDFASFCSAHAQVKETVRTVLSIDVIEEKPLIRIRVSGTGFLYNMVRIIAGTLIEVGNGKFTPQQVKTILDARDREQAGPCAPAVGLTLQSIVYEEQLAKELLVSNDKMFYRFIQQDIEEKKRAYLIIYWCQEEELPALLARMALKSFRLGASRMYVRHDGERDLAGLLGASKRNGFAEKEYFTAGDYRFTLDNSVEQLDRDLRANPPVIMGTERLTWVPISEGNVKEFLDVYNKCFYSLQGAITYDRDDAALLMSAEHRDGYLLQEDGFTKGVCIVGQSMEDGDALELYAIGIVGKYRRKGYAKEVVEHVAQLSAKQGKKRVTLHVMDKNTKAKQLYIQQGYYRIREKHRWYAVDSTKSRPVKKSSK